METPKCPSSPAPPLQPRGVHGPVGLPIPGPVAPGDRLHVAGRTGPTGPTAEGLDPVQGLGPDGTRWEFVTVCELENG